MIMMRVKLPNGLLDGADLFNYVEIDELRGKQQNYLANRDLVIGNVGHIPKILEDLVKSLQTEQGLAWKGDIGEAIYKLPTGDLETILIKIREHTYGPRFYHQADCPHCNHINKDLRIDLDTLEIEVLSVKDMMDKAPRTFMLPKCKKEVELKPLYLRDLFDSIKITADKHDQLITSAMSLFIRRLGDNNKVTSKDLEDMPSADIAYLNDVVETSDLKLEGTIDTDIINECAKCKKEFNSKLNPFDPYFFSPTRGSKSTPT
jgi:ssDNA-binding Zn-finger/Zn-ribbon topoisomerase 1